MLCHCVEEVDRCSQSKFRIEHYMGNPSVIKTFKSSSTLVNNNSGPICLHGFHFVFFTLEL